MFFYTVEKPPRLSEFDLEVPNKLIAQNPMKKRDQCNHVASSSQGSWGGQKKTAFLKIHNVKNGKLNCIIRPKLCDLDYA